MATPAGAGHETDPRTNNYPYFDSGIVVVSGIEQGFFVLRPSVRRVERGRQRIGLVRHQRWDVRNHEEQHQQELVVSDLDVTDVTKTGSVYAPGDNHDPDGDSDGTTIVVLKP